jgi:hypothetical protein
VVGWGVAVAVGGVVAVAAAVEPPLPVEEPQAAISNVVTQIAARWSGKRRGSERMKNLTRA